MGSDIRMFAEIAEGGDWLVLIDNRTAPVLEAFLLDMADSYSVDSLMVADHVALSFGAKIDRSYSFFHMLSEIRCTGCNMPRPGVFSGPPPNENRLTSRILNEYAPRFQGWAMANDLFSLHGWDQFPDVREDLMRLSGSYRSRVRFVWGFDIDSPGAAACAHAKNALTRTGVMCRGGEASTYRTRYRTTRGRYRGQRHDC